jgi:hypothetical protein
MRSLEIGIGFILEEKFNQGSAAGKEILDA